jgi:undecaprenyl-diphosphatase
VAAGVVALALAKLAVKLYYDPRPFVHGACQAVVPHAADNGFPSDHTLLGAVMAAIVWRYSKLWSVIIGLLTIAVGTARVAGCIHSPIDIIGAFVIGIAGALIGRWLVDKLWPNSPEIKESA